MSTSPAKHKEETGSFKNLSMSDLTDPLSGFGYEPPPTEGHASDKLIDSTKVADNTYNINGEEVTDLGDGKYNWNEGVGRRKLSRPEREDLSRLGVNIDPDLAAEVWTKGGDLKVKQNGNEYELDSSLEEWGYGRDYLFSEIFVNVAGGEAYQEEEEKVGPLSGFRKFVSDHPKLSVAVAISGAFASCFAATQDYNNDGETLAQEAQMSLEDNNLPHDLPSLAPNLDYINPLNWPAMHMDLDGDGISTYKELQGPTSWKNPDTDGDGLLDGKELERGTNPLHRDSDGDGLLDGQEVDMGINPLSRDSDFDTKEDPEDPEPAVYNRKFVKHKDTDGDGVWDLLDPNPQRKDFVVYRTGFGDGEAESLASEGTIYIQNISYGRKEKDVLWGPHEIQDWYNKSDWEKENATKIKAALDAMRNYSPEDYEITAKNIDLIYMEGSDIGGWNGYHYPPMKERMNMSKAVGIDGWDRYRLKMGNRETIRSIFLNRYMDESKEPDPVTAIYEETLHNVKGYGDPYEEGAPDPRPGYSGTDQRMINELKELEKNLLEKGPWEVVIGAYNFDE